LVRSGGRSAEKAGVRPIQSYPATDYDLQPHQSGVSGGSERVVSPLRSSTGPTPRQRIGFRWQKTPKVSSARRKKKGKLTDLDHVSSYGVGISSLQGETVHTSIIRP